jgi:hypothetical protein
MTGPKSMFNRQEGSQFRPFALSHGDSGEIHDLRGIGAISP